MTGRVGRLSLQVLLVLAVALAWPRAAAADLVHLTNGRVLSVESWRLEGETAILVLRDGGEIQAPQSAIAEVFPDEYVRTKPEPLPAAVPVASLLPLYTDDLHALVASAAVRYGVDVKLAQAVVKVESNYQSNAVSPKGAMGLMQLMPAVARQYAVDPFNPSQNVDAGIRVLRGLLDRYNNDVRMALAAYNAGLMAVAKYGGIPPYRETQDYVRRITALAR